VVEFGSYGRDKRKIKGFYGKAEPHKGVSLTCLERKPK